MNTLAIDKLILGLLTLLLVACQKKEAAAPVFRLLEADQTGLAFSNELKPTKDLNIFTYMYFYNGSGIGAGDFNNDGLIDLCFTANLQPNRLYLNRSATGAIHFDDVTTQTGINTAKGWANGVSVVDINQDGMLDLYISQVGGFADFKGHNLLFVCQQITKEGIPVYAEKSAEYGLNLTGLGTQAAFLDYDADGDLDMFQLNHSVHQNGTFGSRSAFRGQTHPTAGDRFFRNDKGKFVEVTRQAGIISDVLGYGLGIGIGDVNFDGYPDLYIGNDFHENDYLYINQRNGTFREDLENEMMHTSQFSMGIDIGDLNNDVFPEIISLDMLPADRDILKRSEGEDSYNIFRYKIRQGYNYQFARNNLQFNNGNNTFSEIGMYAGVHATDWSWSPLFMDFDNDGRKDLFISNGIPKRMNDIDYIQFVSSEDIQQRLERREMDENDQLLIDKLPEIKLPNAFFRNQPDLRFQALQEQIENNKPAYSNGAVYADLDNDGDLDIVTSNINDKAFVYENLANTNTPQHASLTLHLTGPAGNRNAVGAQCLVFRKGDVISAEKYPVRGFQSSMEVPLTIGLGTKAAIDSVLLIWPDRRYQRIALPATGHTLTLTYQPDLPRFDYDHFRKKRAKGIVFSDITPQVKLDYRHIENNYNEFDRDALIPHLMSAEGPPIAVADINADGRDDVFAGSSRDATSAVFIQQANGTFSRLPQPSLEQDSVYEDTDAIFVDVNQDTFPDLVVASGGNEYSGTSAYTQPRLYLNDGRGHLMRRPDAFPGIYLTASCVRAMDITGDGQPELFFGGRTVPAAYGKAPRSYLLRNEGNGRFTDITESVSPELATIGLVKNASWVDLDRDKDPDLLLSLEWDSVCLLENQGGHFSKKILTTAKGWWNFTLPADFDQDGDLDILVGNLGLNSRLKATPDQPVRLYVGDFDDNQKVDQLVTYYLNGEEILFSNKAETEKQFPFIKKKFIYAKDFAKASLVDLIGKRKLEDARILETNTFDNLVLVNNGRGEFTPQPLPYTAQWSPYYAAQLIDANGDQLPDVLLSGNFYGCNIQMGRYDADYGIVLINQGNCRFAPVALSGLAIKGEVKHLVPIRINGNEAILVARNNERLLVIKKATL
ncbi:VCBS repeat-containing protein [Nibrella viscosa]|uniref:VCBS repeat-containing protein n=1 Tax=Nibrella viscosa TaxID=1084524 RepID=A0ABP8K439_9BACT